MAIPGREREYCGLLREGHCTPESGLGFRPRSPTPLASTFHRRIGTPSRRQISGNSCPKSKVANWPSGAAAKAAAAAAEG
jgi:hypothetical protein